MFNTIQTGADIFHEIAAIRAASAPAHKAWATIRAQQASRSAAAHKAWATMRDAKASRSEAAMKAWKTRRAAA